MIRKWLKFNTSFIEILKNSAVTKNLDQKWTPDIYFKYHESCSSLPTTSFSPTPSTSSIKSIQMLQTIADPKERGDGEIINWPEDDSEQAVAETPAKTELFQIKGPNGSAFLVEVHSEDLEEVRAELIRLRGDFFRFDRTVIEWFAIKCILTAEPLKMAKDQMRLVKIHVISSGCEEVHELYGSGQYMFVNGIDRTMRAKRILEKLGYRISGILYRFQPKQKVVLEEHLLRLCNDFVRTVEQLPKVISVTHNL